MTTPRKKKEYAYGLTDEVVDGLLNGVTTHEEVFGEGGIYRSLTKRLFERMLESELTEHLGYQKHQKPPDTNTVESGGNSRNGSPQRQ
ncbi:MAG: transposase [Ignavibacteriae bacterium]|nr:transposase [Ignavibacteriota bacterium]